MLSLLPVILPDTYREPDMLTRLQAVLADSLCYDELFAINSEVKSHLLCPLVHSDQVSGVPAGRAPECDR